MRKIAAALAFAVSALLAGRAVLVQFITLATNDPHAYQPVLKEALAYSMAAILIVLLFIVLARGRSRLSALLPIGLCAIAWWGIARMWPYAFA